MVRILNIRNRRVWDSLSKIIRSGKVGNARAIVHRNKISDYVLVPIHAMISSTKVSRYPQSCDQ
jgi:hypothetical protein